MPEATANIGGKYDLHIQLLSAFSVRVAGEAIPDGLWKSRRARSLVKLLALAPGHRLHRDQVMDALWPESDLSAAANNFHQTLYAARRILAQTGGFSLALEEGVVSLSAGKGQLLSVDVEQFETAASQAKDSQDPAVFQAALDLYYGDLLPDDLYVEWTIQRRDALRRVYLNLLLNLARLQEARQEYPNAITTLQRLLAADRGHEEAHVQLMHLYARSGQRQQALRQYQALREALKKELDAEPNERTNQLHEAIQAGRFSPAQSPARTLPTGMVTFLFTDIEGSTPLWEQQPKTMKSAVDRHHAILRQAIEANGGQVFQVIGDAFQAVFRLATDALRAALAAQRALAAAQWGPTGPLKVRMGLHTGPAELDASGNAPYQVSHTLNRSARIMSAGYGGQILLSQEVKDLVERGLPEGARLADLGEHQLKGMQWPEHLYQLDTLDLPADFPALATGAHHPHNLPLQLTSFIGREKQIAEVSNLLKNHRLLTLTGSGGTGKTRLALQAAGELLDAFPDGAWLVELAPLADPDGVPQAVAAALGLQKSSEISYQAMLLNYLQKKHLLLVLDNCEHLLEACASLAHELLMHCPAVTLLATSREALGSAGETAYRVPSLAAPDPAALQPDELAHIEAVRLFAERAAAILPNFQLTPESLPHAARICHRLDGIPLAIELAAARVGVLSVEQIAARLDDRFRLLTGGARTALPRQRTLRASIDWSYSLLPETERNLLQRLSVFSGGWTLAAVEQVCVMNGTESWEILDGLASLVNKSLVTADHRPGGETHYRMLETIRQYAQEYLEGTGQDAPVRDAHLAYFLALAEESEALLRSPRIEDALDRLDLELDNLRSALNWALGAENRTGAEQAARMVCALTYFWDARAMFFEAIVWLERALPLLSEEDPARAELRAKACFTLGYLYGYTRIDQVKARLNIEESVRLYRRLGNQRGLALALSLNYAILFVYYDLIASDRSFPRENAPALKAESLAIATELFKSNSLADRWSAARSCYYIGLGDWNQNLLEECLPRLEQARMVFTELGDRLGEIYAIILVLNIPYLVPPEESKLLDSHLAPDPMLIEYVLSLVHRLHLIIHQAALYGTLGEIAYNQGHFENMVSYFEKLRQLGPQTGDVHGLIWANRMSGLGQLCLGNIPAARNRLHEGLELALQHNDSNGVLAAFIHLAGTAAAAQDAQQAARLLGFVERQYEGFFMQIASWDKLQFDRYSTQVKSKLDVTEFRTLWQGGREMTMEAALEMARKV